MSDPARAVLLAALVVLSVGARGEGREVRLAFLGDSGMGNARQAAVRDQILRIPPRAVFLLGDNVYPNGEPKYFGPRYDDVYRPLFALGVRFHAALGNHDIADCAWSSQDPLPASAQAYLWHTANCEVERHLAHPSFGYVQGRRYYSVALPDADAVLVEVFVLDSNTLAGNESKLPNGRTDTAQLAWLRESVGSSKAPWKIVVMHHPVHSPPSAPRYVLFGSRDADPAVAPQLEPILKAGGVDAVFAGHNHFYARLLPRKGIRYFISGGGGGRVYPFKPRPDLVANGGPFHHYVAVRLTGERFEYWAIDDAGVCRDGGWFARGDPKDTVPSSCVLPLP